MKKARKGGTLSIQGIDEEQKQKFRVASATQGFPSLGAWAKSVLRKASSSAWEDRRWPMILSATCGEMKAAGYKLWGDLQSSGYIYHGQADDSDIDILILHSLEYANVKGERKSIHEWKRERDRWGYGIGLDFLNGKHPAKGIEWFICLFAMSREVVEDYVKRPEWKSFSSTNLWFQTNRIIAQRIGWNREMFEWAYRIAWETGKYGEPWEGWSMGRKSGYTAPFHYSPMPSFEIRNYCSPIELRIVS